MSILVDENSRIVVQGITGQEGRFHTRQMLEYKTSVVAGVTPGKGGQEVDGVPVFNTVKTAVEKEGANVSCIFVPPPFAADAIVEAAAAGIGVIVCITEGIPILDMVRVGNYIKDKDVVLIGPNCPGIISPGKTKVGIMPAPIHREGEIGVISRSGTLTYEVVYQLTGAGFGQSTCIGIGGDPIVGTSFIDHLKKFSEDPQTTGVGLIGEIGGTAEEEAAEYIKKNQNFFGIHLTNFSCGPDSFIEHFYKNIMKNKPYLILELDEHSATAGIITRLEAYKNIIEN